MLIVVIAIIAAVMAVLPIAGLRSARARRASHRAAVPARRLVRAAFAVAMASALLLALVQVAVVLLVSVFSVSVIWLQESTAYLFGAMFLLGAGGVFLTDGHVRVDVLSSRWTERRRAVVDLGGIALFLIPVCALIVIVSAPWAAESWARLERSGEPSGLHAVYLLKSLVPLFAILLALAGFVRADRAARRLTEG